jgi:hypothetical protein
VDRNTLNVLMLIAVGSIVLTVLIVEPILWLIKLFLFFLARWRRDADAPEPWKTAQTIDEDQWGEAEEEL